MTQEATQEGQGRVQRVIVHGTCAITRVCVWSLWGSQAKAESVNSNKRAGFW